MLPPVTRLPVKKLPVTRLRDFRMYGHPLLLIAVWSTLQAASIVWVALLPGDPSNSSEGMGSVGQAIFWTGALVLFLVLGSRIAWWLAIFFNTVAAFLGVAFGVFEFGVKPWGVALFQAAALWLLWSGNIETYVKSHRRVRLTGPPPAH
jgi:hypothetical protein